MKNKVELLGYYGSDITHAQSAWTSTSRELKADKIERVPKLLNMLASEGHHTPFEKSMLHFLVDVDQATHIHLLKHRIGVSINGESARYKELKEDKYYLPEDFNAYWFNKLNALSQESNKLYHDCLNELSVTLGRKRAKESARYFKLFNSQITMDISFNFRSFVHFYRLRADEHAQKEVRELAEQMLKLIQDIDGNPFKETLKAFNLSNEYKLY